MKKKRDGDSAASGIDPHLQSLFVDAPIPIWEEDYSQVKRRLDEWKREGISNFETFFRAHPDELARLAGMVRILNLNKAARLSAGIPEDSDKPGLLDVFSPETFPVFQRQIMKILDGEVSFSGESITTAGQGGPKYYVYQWTVVPGHEADYSRVIVSAIDLTTTKKAEAALKQSELKFATAFRSSPDALIISSMTNGHFMDVNDSFLEIFGYRREEVIGNPFLAREMWEDPRQRKGLNAILRSQGGVKDFRTRFRKRDGEVVVVSLSCEPIMLEKEPCLLTIARDVTQLDETRRALMESEEKYRTLVEAATDGIFIVQDGSVCFANSRMEQISGYSVEEITGMPFLDFVDPDHREMVDTFYMKRIQGGAVPSRYEIRAIAKSGRSIEVEINVTDFQFLGKPALLVFLSDITGRHQAEKELRESERRYRAIFENTGTATVMVERDNRISLANQKFVELSGYSRKEIEGHMRWTDFVEPAWLDRMQEYRRRRRFSRDAAPRQYEFEFRDRQGRIKQVLLNVDIIPGTDVTIASLLDVTISRQMNERIRQAQKIEMVGQLAGGVAHDFNNLLTVISGYSDMILGEKELPPEVHQKVSQIRRAGERAQKLTNQLLAFSRKQMVQPESMDLNRVIRESMGMLSSLIGEDLRVELDLEESIPMIFADPHQIEQILINLMMNARDSIRERDPAAEERRIRIVTGSGVMLEVSLDQVPSGPTSPAVVWSVVDSGTGMDEETRSRIFEPFFTTKESSHGTGLGLASVFGIIRQNNADIRVFSNPGEGSMFRVFWPIKGDDVTLSSRVTPVESGKGTPLVLLVGEDTQTRRFAGSEIKKAGVRVLDTGNLEKALDLLAAPGFSPDLLILDQESPGTPGEGTVRRLRESHPDLPLIILSGFVDDRNRIWEEYGPGLLVMQKPFALTDLCDLIRKFKKCKSD